MLDALLNIIEWLGDGIYDFVAAALAYWIEWATIAAIKAKLFMMQLSWDIAKNIMANTGLSALINTAWAGVDSRILGYATFFRLPEAINIIIQAHIAKFSLSMLGH